MLSTDKIIAFLATANAVSTRAFYCDQLGFTAVFEDDFALVLDAYGTELRIQKLQELIPQPFTVLGWSVTSIEKTVSSLTAAGVIFERFGGMQQNDLGVWQSPSGAKIAWFKDPDGNMLSLTEHKST